MSFNRLSVCRNPYQGTAKKVLCVCSAGLLRSPTLAWVLSQEPWNYNTRSCGSDKGFALIPIDDVLIEWADLIIFVNEENEERVRKDYDLSRKEIKILSIEDSYAFRDPKLVSLLTKICKDF